MDVNVAHFNSVQVYFSVFFSVICGVVQVSTLTNV